jgi:hypothetical protein
MRSPAMIIVTNHIFELHAEAAANRLANEARRSESRRNSRIAAALTSLRSLLSNPADDPMALPKLTEYPYRS